MLLTVDVGNTNITIGVFDGDQLKATLRLVTKTERTSDELGQAVWSMLRAYDIEPKKITDVIIASVVPNVMHALINCIRKYFKIEPTIVGPGIKTGIKIVTPEPNQIGTDRIVDAAAAYSIYGGPVLVLDFGTATTYDLITEDGSFIAAVTAPGIKISANALWNDAAKLPEIEIKKPDSILAKETVSSMQAGLVYGQIGQTEYICRKMIEESGIEGVKVVATGGLGRIIADECSVIDQYDAQLTLKGMKIIYDKQKK